jgi:UDP-GlcNAc:undecaprenyl-phosphate/decaprenyl-phosphate GlcNAc-1-phosphate transferase
MIWACMILVPVAMVVSLPLTALMIRLGHRLETFDSPGVPGQVKAPARRVPNTGGIAIFWAIVAPMVLGLVFASFVKFVGEGGASWMDEMRRHLPGIREQTPLAVLVLLCTGGLHVLGLIDDRRPMGPWVKLGVMALPPIFIVSLFPETRLLTMLDGRAGGPWLSIVVTVGWFLVVTNALNFLDNMDGLSAGVAAIAGTCFLAAALLNRQWFVGATLALIVGACLGFLVFNFRPGRGGARIFMGDGGSLVLGFLLAFLTVRTTYYRSEGTGLAPLAGGWYGVFMPLVVLAVPIYDFVSVCAIRISQGKSPFVGDRQHLSHRLVRLGLSEASAVGVIYGLTAVTGLAGIVLGSLAPWQAVVVGIQTIVILLLVGVFEYSRARPGGGR